MKVRIQHGLIWAALVAAGAAQAPSAWAQKERGSGAPQSGAASNAKAEDPFTSPSVSASAEEVDPLDRSIDYQSKQSTVGGFVLSINDSVAGLNIVVTPDAAAITLPQMDLKRVKVRSALRLLSRIHPQLRIDEDDNARVVGESRVILISWQGPSENSAYRVISVKHLLSTLDQEKLLEALDDGYSFIQHGGSKPELRLHQATGLLFVKGSEPQVTFAANIVAELSRMPGATAGYGSKAGFGSYGPPPGYGGAGSYGSAGMGEAGPDGYSGGGGVIYGVAPPGYSGVGAAFGSGPPPGYGGGPPTGYLPGVPSVPPGYGGAAAGGAKPSFGGSSGGGGGGSQEGESGGGIVPGGAGGRGPSFQY